MLKFKPGDIVEDTLGNRDLVLDYHTGHYYIVLTLNDQLQIGKGTIIKFTKFDGVLKFWYESNYRVISYSKLGRILYGKTTN